MRYVGVLEAKTQLSALLDAVENKESRSSSPVMGSPSPG